MPIAGFLGRESPLLREKLLQSNPTIVVNGASGLLKIFKEAFAE
jgi:hypothetical protein